MNEFRLCNCNDPTCFRAIVVKGASFDFYVDISDDQADIHPFKLPNGVRFQMGNAPKPNLSEKPEWARWWALTHAHVSVFFEVKPTLTTNGHWYSSGKMQFGSTLNLPLGIDYRTTLTEV